MSRTSKFAGKFSVVDWDFQWTDVGGGPYNLSIPDGSYYVLGDGTADDLLEALETAINAVSDDSFTATLGATGIVTLSTAADAAVLTWTAAGEDLRDVLRYSGATLPLSDPGTAGARTARYVVSGAKVHRDIPTARGRRSVSEADDYTLSTLTLSATNTRYNLGLRYNGPHRSTEWEEHDAWLALFNDIIKPGVLCRYYPDDSVSTAYAQQSNPFGYHVGRISSPAEWTPRQLFDGWDEIYVADLTFVEQTA